MKKWDSALLGDIARPKQWPTLSKKDLLDSGFPVFGANGPIGFTDSYTHERPTILIGCRGSCGTIHLTPPRAYANGNAMALDELDESRVYPGFLVHYFIERGFKDVTTGTSQPQIIGQNLVRIRVPIPPISEQRRIATILDQAEALRAKRRVALAKIDTLAQSLFIEMFGDPFKNEKKYPTVRMGDVCDVRDGTHDSPKYVESNGYPLVTSKNLSSGRVDLTGANLISKDDFEQVNKRSKVDLGDILLPMIGTIGSPVIVEEEPVFAIKNVALIKFKSDSPSNIFVHHLLAGRYFDQVLSQTNRGGTQKFVSLGDLRAFPLVCPPEKDQQTFVARIRKMGGLASIMQGSLLRMDSLFQSLQHRAFQGEL